MVDGAGSRPGDRRVRARRVIEPSDYLEQARKAFEEAEALANLGLLNGSVSRAYYAIFYVASGLLASRGGRYSRHTADVGQYGILFGRTAILDRAFHQLLIVAGRRRMIADYGPWTEEPEIDDAIWLIAEGQRFLAAARGYLAGR